MKLKPKHIFYLGSAFTLALLTSSCIPFGGSVGSSPVPTPNPNPSPTPTPPTPPANGWQILASPPIGGGRANNVGLASDSYGNLYASYQTESNLTVYRYMFNQTTPQWQQVASPLAVSNHSPYSTIAVSNVNDIYLAYTGPNHEAFYLRALPDMSGWSSQQIVQTTLAYTGSAGTIGCATIPARVVNDDASYVSMALINSGQQMIAYKDDTYVLSDSQVNPVESNSVCTSPAYDGKGTLSVFVSASMNWSNISAGSVSQVRIAATPNNTNSYPIYVAYQDNLNNSSITVQKLSSPQSDAQWQIVGESGFTGFNANFISIAADSNGTPYVAYQDAGNNNKLTVQNFTNGAWHVIGGTNISTGIASYISLAINAESNIVFVAYQDSGQNNNLFVNQYVPESNVWIPVGGTIQNLNNNYGTYTALTVMPNSGEPAMAFQNGAQNVSSSLTVMYSTVNIPYSQLLNTYGNSIESLRKR